MRSLFLALLLLVIAPGTDQQSSPPIPRVLRGSSSQPLGVPPFGAYDNAYCDNDRNLFFHIGAETASFNKGVIMKLAPNSQMPTLYQLPGEFSGKIGFLEFFVTPSGSVWLLEEAPDGTIYAFGFDSDGSMASRSRLDAPEHLRAADFVVSEHGVTLLGGYFNNDAPENLRGKTYLALFEKSGKLRKEIKQESIQDVDLKDITKKLHDGGVGVGPEGNFYFLHSNEILVISEYGDVVRRLSFRRPAKDATATKIDLSDGALSIHFVKPNKDGPLLTQFLLLDSATGEPFALYEPSDELGNNCVCFSHRDGYTFFRIENGKVKLVSAPLT
jgi:hypothetical protein